MMATITLALHCLGFAADPAIVQTAQGAVRGIVTEHSRKWLGIPFAEPPVGKLRWQSPQTPTAWAPDAVKDATDFGHNCLQSGTSFDMGWPQPRSTLSEDCLFLNVYSGPANKTKSAPVLFWIYGGGFQGGGGNETRLNGTWDAALMAGELVVVTSNYRLGSFGFAASKELSKRETALAGETRGTGNYGILDQRAAMAWVQKNIGGFGGDPSRVLIVGQSAGASSVSQHLVRPASWGLFSAAGMESGAFYDGTNTPTLVESEPRWTKFVRKLGCEGAADRLACMVALPADAILNETDARGEVWSNPVVDGVDLAASGPELAEQGRLAPAAVFAGGVEEDISTFDSSCSAEACTRGDFVHAAVAFGFEEAEAEQLASQYADDPIRPGRTAAQRWAAAIQHAGADGWSNCAARRVVRWYARLQRPAWWYKWSFVPAGPNGRALSHHSVEQPYVFHVLSETREEQREDGGKYHIASDEAPFSERIARAWAAMAASGDPNAAGAAGVGWPLFNASTNGSALLIEGGAGTPGSFRAAANLMATKCDLFDGLFFGRRGPKTVVRPRQ